MTITHAEHAAGDDLLRAAKAHTLVVTEVMRHRAAIRARVADEGRNGLDSVEAVLTAILATPGIHPDAHAAVQRAAEQWPALYKGFTTSEEHHPLARRVLGICKEAKSLAEVLGKLEGLRGDPGLAGTPGAATGLELAIAILRDGQGTIYNPDSDLYDGLGRRSAAARRDAKKDAAVVAGSMVAADAVGAVAGAILGSAAGGLGAGPGAIVSGVACSASAGLAVGAGVAVANDAAGVDDSPPPEEGDRLGAAGPREILERAMRAHPYIRSFVQEIGPGATYSGSEVDRATTSLNLNPGRYNVALSNPVETPLGTGLHIPVAISEREGGRKSILNLKAGEEVHTGTFLIGAKVFHQHMMRVSGTDTPARQADYRERVATADGLNVYERMCRLTMVDEERGVVHLRPYAEGSTIFGHPDPSPGDGPSEYYENGICYLCNAGSSWWCGFPCIPAPGGPLDPSDDGPIA